MRGELIARRSDVRVTLWSFPLTREFNPVLSKAKRDRYPQAYAMALAAEAAYRLGGNTAFWRMHAVVLPPLIPRISQYPRRSRRQAKWDWIGPASQRKWKAVPCSARSMRKSPRALCRLDLGPADLH